MTEGGSAARRRMELPGSTVMTARRETVTLERFLLARYPSIFRFSESDPHVLVMTRPERGAELALSELLELGASEMRQDAGMEVPDVLLRER